MSDYSSLAAPQQSFNKSQAFAAALQRAKQIAAKINPSSGGSDSTGTKRALDEGSEPDAKKMAGSPVGGMQRPSPANLVPGLGGGVVTEDIKVPDKMVGLIIGRGGEQITRLQSESGCKIQMAADSGGAPDRICTLTGNPQAIRYETNDNDLREVYQVLSEVHRDQFGERKFEVDGLWFSVRGIILKKIAEFFTKAGLDAKHLFDLTELIIIDSDSMEDGITLRLTGTYDAVIRAKDLVNAIVHQRYKTEGPGSEPRSDIMIPTQPQPQPHSNPSFVEIMLPGPKVGLVIGKGGETIKQLQEKSGAKMVVIQEGPNQEAEKPLRITGDPQKVDHAKSLVYELLAEKESQFSQSRGGGGMNRGGGSGGGRGGFGGGRGGFNQRGGGDEAQFVVPSNKCGVIIGRGGETIKQINQATGAHCELDRRPNNNPNEKIFIIRGTSDQIEAAKAMIGDKLGQQGGGGGGPSGGPSGGGGGFPQQWGQPQQQYQSPYQQPDPSGMQMGGGGGMPNMGGGGGPGGAPQADYSQQWIEYYRSQGMHNEADAIEQQTKAKQAQAAAAVAAQQPQPTPQSQQNGGAGGGGGGAGAPDYSAQWAQYYRILGKVKEAEMIEQQMKTKGGGGGPQQAVGGPQQPQQGGGGGPGGFPGYYPGGGAGGGAPGGGGGAGGPVGGGPAAAGGGGGGGPGGFYPSYHHHPGAGGGYPGGGYPGGGYPGVVAPGQQGGGGADGQPSQGQ